MNPQSFFCLCPILMVSPTEPCNLFQDELMLKCDRSDQTRFFMHRECFPLGYTVVTSETKRSSFRQLL